MRDALTVLPRLAPTPWDQVTFLSPLLEYVVLQCVAHGWLHFRVVFLFACLFLPLSEVLSIRLCPGDARLSGDCAVCALLWFSSSFLPSAPCYLFLDWITWDLPFPQSHTLPTLLALHVCPATSVFHFLPCLSSLTFHLGCCSTQPVLESLLDKTCIYHLLCRRYS